MSSTPRLPADETGTHGNFPHTPELRAAWFEAYGIIWGGPSTADLMELIRIRTVRHVDCFTCRNTRFELAGERIHDESVYEGAREDPQALSLPDRLATVIKLADAVMNAGGEASDQLRQDISTHMSQETILECVMYSATTFNRTKMKVVLGDETGGDGAEPGHLAAQQASPRDVAQNLKSIESVVRYGPQGSTVWVP